jgi:hypothetical protein
VFCVKILSIDHPSYRSHEERGFFFIEEAQKTFDKMKEVMISYPILALLDYTQPFVLECDASGVGIGEFLMQKKNPITYGRRNISTKKKHCPIYDKEILAIMHALEKFRQYMVGG